MEPDCRIEGELRPRVAFSTCGWVSGWAKGSNVKHTCRSVHTCGLHRAAPNACMPACMESAPPLRCYELACRHAWELPPLPF
eukprot:340794-Chlamydomonas_euryale.AAC.1